MANEAQHQHQQTTTRSTEPWYQKGAVPLGSCIAGIPIYLHWTFFILMMFMMLTILITDPSNGVMWGVMVLLYGPILLVTIILHELGHAFMTKRLGGQVGDLVLWPLGGYVVCGTVESVIGDFKVAAAGPLTHIPQMVLWVAIFAGLEGGDFSNFSNKLDTENLSFGSLLAAQAFFLNLVLFIFNLFVPAYPLDGGRCLGAGLILAGLPVVKAAIATAGVGMTLAAIMVIWGIIDFVSGAPTGLFTALIGLWIFRSSLELFRLTQPMETAADNLKQHPVFGQACYQNRARGEAASAQQQQQQQQPSNDNV